MGPVFQRTTLFVANTTRQPLQDAPAWQHRFPETDVIMEYSIASTTTGVEYEITSGSEVLVQRGNCPGGATIGVFGNFQEVKKAIVAFAGREIAVTVFETAAGTPTVMLEVHLTPV